MANADADSVAETDPTVVLAEDDAAMVTDAPPTITDDPVTVDEPQRPTPKRTRATKAGEGSTRPSGSRSVKASTAGTAGRTSSGRPKRSTTSAPQTSESAATQSPASEEMNPAPKRTPRTANAGPRATGETKKRAAAKSPTTRTKSAQPLAAASETTNASDVPTKTPPTDPGATHNTRQQAPGVASIPADDHAADGDPPMAAPPKATSSMDAVTPLASPTSTGYRRRLATAVAVLALAIGIAIGFLLGATLGRETSPSSQRIAIDQPSATPAPAIEVNPAPTPATPTTLLQLNGSGPDQSTSFRIPSGATTIQYESAGGTFELRLQSRNSGAPDSFLCTERCQRTATLIKDEGEYFVVVAGSSRWSVRVTT